MSFSRTLRMPLLTVVAVLAAVALAVLPVAALLAWIGLGSAFGALAAVWVWLVGADRPHPHRGSLRSGALAAAAATAGGLSVAGAAILFQEATPLALTVLVGTALLVLRPRLGGCAPA